MASLQTISSQAWADTPASTTPIPPEFTCTEGDRVVWVMRSVGDMQIHCTVELQGRIQAERLARALRLAIDQEPILGCSYEQRWWRSRWRRHHNLDQLSLCTVEETDDVAASLQAFLTHELDPTADALCHVRVLRHNHDTLCFKVSHFVMDAGGVKQLIYRVADLYRQLEQYPKLQVTPHLTGSRSMWQVAQQLGWRAVMPAIRRGVIDLYRRVFPMRYWDIPTQKAPNTQRTYVFAHIEPEQFRAMKAFSRQHNATLNDLLVAAYLRALARTFEVPSNVPMRAMNTVDLRRYMPGRAIDRLCNLSNFCYPCLPRDPEEDFVQTVAKVRDQMNQWKAGMLGLGELHLAGAILNTIPAALWRALAPLGVWFMTAIRLPVLTNIGQLDSHQLNFDDLPISRAYLSASVIYPPLFGSGCSGYAEQLTLSAGFCETSIASSTITELFAQTLRELPS